MSLPENLEAFNRIQAFGLLVGYIDPGAGALAYQLLASALVGILFALRRWAARAWLNVGRVLGFRACRADDDSQPRADNPP